MLLLSSAAYYQLTKEQKSKATDHLKSGLEGLARSVKGLSEAQLNYNPTAPDGL